MTRALADRARKAWTGLKQNALALQQNELIGRAVQEGRL